MEREGLRAVGIGTFLLLFKTILVHGKPFCLEFVGGGGFSRKIEIDRRALGSRGRRRPGVRETLYELFEQEGYAVASASNGAEALAVLAEIEIPVLILLDQNMPVMNGMEFLAHKALRPELAGIPVIVMSAERALDHGFEVADFLPKPFNVLKLLKTVEHYSCYSARRAPAVT